MRTNQRRADVTTAWDKARPLVRRGHYESVYKILNDLWDAANAEAEAKLRVAENENARLRKTLSDEMWRTNPDRMGS